MRIFVTIGKADIVRANILLLTRSSSSLKGLVVFIIGIGAFIYFTRSSEHDLNLPILVVASLIGGIAAFLISCSISLLWILKNSTVEAGVTGEHLFEITDQGFHEKTSQNDSLQLWKGMWTPLRSRNLILVRINAYLFHVLPRRAFRDDAEYDAWWNELQRRSSAA